MNCRPGDLAVVIAAPNEGVLVRVIRPSPCRGFDWEVECLSDAVSATTGKRWPRGSIGDSMDVRLRPIRPDGVTDDEVRELYAPNLQGEIA